MAHYSWYNLSTQGKQSTAVAFEVIGFGAEAFVFAYLGLTFFSYETYPISWMLIVIFFAIIMVGRLFGTLGLVGVMKLFGHKPNTSLKELIFIWYAGLIRGAIAFGLVLSIEKDVPNRGVIVTTSLWLVVLTTIIFGSTVGLMSKKFFSGQPPSLD